MFPAIAMAIVMAIVMVISRFSVADKAYTLFLIIFNRKNVTLFNIQPKIGRRIRIRNKIRLLFSELI